MSQLDLSPEQILDLMFELGYHDTDEATDLILRTDYRTTRGPCLAFQGELYQLVRFLQAIAHRAGWDAAADLMSDARTLHGALARAEMTISASLRHSLIVFPSIDLDPS